MILDEFGTESIRGVFITKNDVALFRTRIRKTIDLGSHSQTNKGNRKTPLS